MIKLSFTDPLRSVSVGEKEDLVLLQINLSEYVSKDGRSLPESVVKFRKVPEQVASDTEAETLALAGEIGATTVQSAVALNFMTNVCQGGSLHLVWSVIEQNQVVSYQQLMKTKVPGNVVAFLD